METAIKKAKKQHRQRDVEHRMYPGPEYNKNL